MSKQEWKLFSGRNRLLWIWLAIGVVVWIGTIIMTEPWGPGLGVFRSPLRVLYSYVPSFAIWAPICLLMYSYQTTQQRWLAPRGQYVEGETYKMWSAYRLSAIALTTALFAACGVFRVEVFDLCALPAAISGIYFDPVVCFFCLYLGGLVRAVFFKGDPLRRIGGIGIADGGVWMAATFVYWAYMSNPESKVYIKSRAVRAIVWNVCVLTVIRVIGFTSTTYFFEFPAANYPALLAFWLTFLPASVASSSVGFIVSEAAVDMVEKGRAT